MEKQHSNHFSTTDENTLFVDHDSNGIGNGCKNGHMHNGTNKSMTNGNVKNENVTNGIKGKVYCGEVPGSQIQDFYNGKSVLLTGATGFVGKVLLERLLVSCPGVDTIYMMIREKKGHSVSTRLKKLLQSPLFAHVDEKILSKVYPVVGDMGLSMLGLCNEDYQMLMEKVHIVLHCAANVRFDASISELIRVNVKGTCDLLELSRKMKYLISFVYVSTIYSNYRKGQIDERLYKPGLDLDVALALESVSAEDEDTLQIINAKILQSWPNLYSFSKCITENAIKIKGQGLPTCIFRPGIVMATSHQHPTPGFVDNTNGVIGTIAAMAMGVAKIVPANRDKCSSVLPADYCANAIIACSWESANKIAPEPKIYNYIPTDRLGWTVGQLISNALKHAVVEPFDQLYGYPTAAMSDNFTIFRIVTILIYFMPGLIADGFRRILGKKPLYLKSYRRLVKHSALGYIFACQVFSFKLRNSRLLQRSMCEVDQNLFKMNIDEYDIPSNFPPLMRGIKQYLLKEKPEPSEEAYQKLRRFKRNYYAGLYLSTILGISFFFYLLHRFIF